ncbi:PspA/IM30 family protein [Pseudoalteromonas luteoviolacea]|uniref:PspA/IM30 family protein n=1 Tax=Pseudoalteromonas luteoviolacea TaxID=43657 RepID=UPI001F43F294|nr:PspA/IM30 family protein [Pseudoalteromonas luteoviolacea]MCF6439290.1 PspA/IM30 family protein [Pseudoalteromonas luteoviolacea]
MSILKKLFTAVKGGVNEVGEGIVDANAIRIFEQEIRDAQAALSDAKRSLTEVMAKEIQTTRAIKSLDEDIAKHETYAAQALDKDEEALALEIAEKIAHFEQEKTEQQQVLNTFTTSVSKLKEQIKQAEKTIVENQRQLSMVKTTESVQKATMAVNDTMASGDSSMASAKQSLERIKQRQMDKQDQLDAAQQLAEENSDKALHDKMRAAGIGEEVTKGADVLARIRAKQNK